jgi:CHAT domain-containing protein/Flp pilus assembly protein TadD
MKKLLTVTSFLFLSLLFSESLAAQEDYKKYMSLSYKEIDSLVMIPYQKGNFKACIPYAQAGREKAKAAFGEQDSVFAEYTNNLGFIYSKTGQYKEAELLFLQAIAIRKKNSGEQHPSYAQSLSTLAGLYLTLENYSKAEPLFLEAMAIEKNALGTDQSSYAQSLNNLAAFFQKMGNYTKAESFYLQALATYKKALGVQHPKYAQSLNNLATLYEVMGHYTKAESLFLEGLAILKDVLGAQHPSYALNLNNLASLYQRMGNYSKAEPFYLQALEINKKVLGEKHPSYANNLSNLAALYKNLENYSMAESLHLQALEIRKKALGELHPSYANNLINLAALYKINGNYSKAKQLYLQAIAIDKKIFGEQHPNYASSLNNLASLYESMGKLDSAFHYCRWSIIANAPAMDISFEDWSNLDTFIYKSNRHANISLKTLLSILQKQYEQTKDKKILEKHYAISQAAIRLNERFRNGFTAEGDKLRILAENNVFVLAAIKTGIELGKKDYEITSFGFSEMNKGVLLLESSKTANAQQFGNLPDSLLLYEVALQKKQSILTAKLLENRADNERDSLRRILNDINQEIDTFTKMLSIKYPKYASLKYNNKTAQAKDIQALLDDKTALLEYMIGDSGIYIFYVDKKQVKVIPANFSTKILNEKINNLQSALSNYEFIKNNPNENYENFTENAHWFYENLVKKALENTKGIEHLIIVPDGEIAHLPFETFLVEKPTKNQRYSEIRYLMKDFRISYNYSATLWKENREQKRNKNNGQLIAMAAQYKGGEEVLRSGLRLPVYERMRQVLNDLPAARKEVESLQKSFRGFFAFDKIATEKVFKEKAEKYAIIHLAMHGLLDKTSPILSSLAFTEDGDSTENNFLQAYEISKLELNADLVVLSACETGYGRFETGNGTASLARAFMYAGVPSLVVSLWQVNDASTAEIMQLFYANLAKGMDKAEALRQAKLKYIAECKNPMMAHPAFWAAFVQIGDSRPVKIVKGELSYWFWPLMTLALIGCFLVVYMKYKKIF